MAPKAVVHDYMIWRTCGTSSGGTDVWDANRTEEGETVSLSAGEGGYMMMEHTTYDLRKLLT